MDELLTKALHDMDFCRSELLDVLKRATSVEAIILMELLEKSAMLRRGIESLLNAKAMDEREVAR